MPKFALEQTDSPDLAIFNSIFWATSRLSKDFCRLPQRNVSPILIVSRWITHSLFPEGFTILWIYLIPYQLMWVGKLNRYSEWLRAGRSGDRIPEGSRFSTPVQTGPVAQTASCTMSTGSFPRVKSGRGVTLTPHPLLVPWSWNGRAIPLLRLWAVRPVQNLSDCTRVQFTILLSGDGY